jgi:diguanylate cyclase (GGDEF)-like protein
MTVSARLPSAVNATDAHPLLDELQLALAATSAPDVLPAAGLREARRAAAQARELGRDDDEALAESWACTHLSRMGRLAEVLEQAAPVLVRLPPALHERRRELLRHITLAASELGRFDLALDAAQELMGMAQSSGRPDDALAASFLLAACLERMGDSWQALRLLADAVAAYGVDRPSYPLLVATNAVCAICLGLAHRLRDTGDDTERTALLAQGRREGERALSLLHQVRGDTYDAAVPGNLGEVLLLQGHLAQAKPLLDHALGVARSRGLQAHQWRVGTSLADWHLAEGDAAAARMRALELIDQMGPEGPLQTVIRARDSAYRSCRALDLLDEALHHLEQAERLERKRSTGQLRSQSQVFVTRSEADRAHADAARQRQRAAEFAAAAERDSLTGLGNRRHLERRCAELLAPAVGDAPPLVLAVLDIDHFKQVNDRYGHLMGDQVLVQVAHLLRENTRGSDVLARYGGEEFVIVLPGMTLAGAAEVCERLRERVHGFGWPLQMALSVSIGLAAAPPHDLTALLGAADRALYSAKSGGRNRIVAL